MRKNGFIIDGITYEVDFTAGSREALEYNYVNEYSVAGSIMGVGEKLNKMMHGEKFIIMERLFRVGIVCSMDRNTDCIEVLAIVREDNVFVKNGIEVYEFNEWAKK